MTAPRRGARSGARGFPRQQAATRRFTLGVPRGFTVDGRSRRLRYLRTRSGRDPVGCLWELDLDEPDPPPARCLVDPRDLDADVHVASTEEERARRERTRELTEGVTAYATDDAGDLIALAVGGRLVIFDAARRRVIDHDVSSGVFDPRPAPDGSAIAYVREGGVHVLELPAGTAALGMTRPVVAEAGVRWGVAEFVAAEEMGRQRGYWWSPDSSRLAVARVDDSRLPRWSIADPSRPWESVREHRYPVAGGANADVRLAVWSTDAARRVEIGWDRERLPYLSRVRWQVGEGERGRLLLQVQTRDQREMAVLVADPDRGGTREIRTLRHDRYPLELVPGSPAWCGEMLVTVEDREEHGRGGSRALVVDGEIVTPRGMQVRTVCGTHGETIVFTASRRDPRTVHVHSWNPRTGLDLLSPDGPGVYQATVCRDHTVLVGSREDQVGSGVSVLRTPTGDHGGAEAGPQREPPVRVEVVAEAPVVRPEPRWLSLGRRALRAALLLPRGDDGRSPLPVVLDPYGGPHAQRVVATGAAMLGSQWLADQGFAVLVVDGRGTPGRGPQWERALQGDLAGPVLADQLAGLRAAAKLEPRLDLDRVAIRGWSFGGYLAALAALREPRMFRAAIVGAPVTDWHLYDTHYTERYLGTPQENADAYLTSGLVDEDCRLTRVVEPRGRPRPRLLIVHGLADDNVVAAHSLRLSSALFSQGWEHRFLPLPGVTHMTPQEDVAERLLAAQVEFLEEALARTP